MPPTPAPRPQALSRRQASPIVTLMSASLLVIVIPTPSLAEAAGICFGIPPLPSQELSFPGAQRRGESAFGAGSKRIGLSPDHPARSFMVNSLRPPRPSLRTLRLQSCHCRTRACSGRGRLKNVPRHQHRFARKANHRVGAGVRTPLHNSSTRLCSSCAISCGSLSAAKLTGSPMRTRIFPGGANFLPACFTSNKPSIRIGTTGTRR